jgi:hypothetical protein
MSFNPCQDCGTNYWGFVFIGLFWLGPLACVAVRRHVGPESELGARLIRPIWLLTFIAVVASWHYLTAWYF